MVWYHHLLGAYFELSYLGPQYFKRLWASNTLPALRVHRYECAHDEHPTIITTIKNRLATKPDKDSERKYAGHERD